MRPVRAGLPYAPPEFVVDVKQHVHVKREGFRFVGDDQQESAVRRDVVAGNAHHRVFGKGFPEQLTFRPGSDATRAIERHFEDPVAGRR